MDRGFNLGMQMRSVGELKSWNSKEIQSRDRSEEEDPNSQKQIFHGRDNNEEDAPNDMRGRFSEVNNQRMNLRMEEQLPNEEFMRRRR